MVLSSVSSGIGLTQETGKTSEDRTRAENAKDPAGQSRRDPAVVQVIEVIR
jgi:hypothetical protein